MRPGAVARRIAAEHNRSVAPEEFARSGGVMIFDTRGRLLATCAQDNFNHGRGLLVYRSRPHPVTQVEVQAWLNARG